MDDRWAWRCTVGAAVLLMSLGANIGCGGNKPPVEPVAEDGGVQTTATAPVGGAPAMPALEASAPTFAYTCTDGHEFVVRIGKEVAVLHQRGAIATLRHERSASGAKYSDGTITLWTKGQEALLEEVGAIHRECRNDPARAHWEHARLTGVQFRARGNEPGWRLDFIAGSKIFLETDHGTNRYSFDLPPPARSESGDTIYRAQASGHSLSVAVRPQTCQDTMSGEQFEAQVTVVIDGRTLHGCGRAVQ